METSMIDTAQSNKYGNIMRLIALWQDFEEQHERRNHGTPARLEEFGAWIQERLRHDGDSPAPISTQPMAIRTATSANKRVTSTPNTQEGTISHQRTDADGTISILLGRMGRYSKLYTKKAFDGQIVTSIDEFALLAAIMQYERMQGNPTKSEVYAATLTEVTTGSEIMRRLEKVGLLEEYADTKDKRMKRVRLTQHGKGAFFQAAQQMGAASHIVAGTLNMAQKQELIQLLTLLDKFHSKMYTEHRTESFTDIEARASEQRAE